MFPEMLTGCPLTSPLGLKQQLEELQSSLLNSKMKKLLKGDYNLRKEHLYLGEREVRKVSIL